MSRRWRVGLVGCGLIGHKRAHSLGESAELIACCDLDLAKAHTLARQHSVWHIEPDWQSLVNRREVEIVLACTTNDALAPIAEAAAQNGKHVLSEKPCARRSSELDAVAAAAGQSEVRVRAGFNHRYHRALQKARSLFEAGVLGDLLYVRGRYGHGGRPGYEKEWRADPESSGGGQALDQGVHLIDLAQWFLGELKLIAGRAPTYFWQMPVEDNAFLLLETASGQVAQLHASWTEWKNLFSFEICGRLGKLEITGLGGSYGTERLTHYQMLPGMGPPLTTIYEYPMADNSWTLEFSEFIQDIETHRTPEPGIREAQAALRLVEQLYQRQS